MSQPRKSHTLEIVERRLGAAESAALVDPMELVGLQDELSRVERKWIEQTAAGSERRRPDDKSKMDKYFDRLSRQVEAALRRADLTAQERDLLEKSRRSIIGRQADWKKSS